MFVSNSDWRIKCSSLLTHSQFAAAHFLPKHLLLQTISYLVIGFFFVIRFFRSFSFHSPFFPIMNVAWFICVCAFKLIALQNIKMLNKQETNLLNRRLGAWANDMIYYCHTVLFIHHQSVVVFRAHYMNPMVIESAIILLLLVSVRCSCRLAT